MKSSSFPLEFNTVFFDLQLWREDSKPSNEALLQKDLEDYMLLKYWKGKPLCCYEKQMWDSISLELDPAQSYSQL